MGDCKKSDMRVGFRPCCEASLARQPCEKRRWVTPLGSFPVALGATRLHLVEGMCKLKTCTHGLKTCTRKRASCRIQQVENLLPQRAGAGSFFLLYPSSTFRRRCSECVCMH